MAKSIELQIRVPREMADEVEAIAKHAGLAAATVIKVFLAVELRRMEKRALAKEQA